MLMYFHKDMMNLVNELYNERIKLNVDWAYTRKYNEVHILCHSVYVKHIKEVAEKLKINIKEFHTYT